MADFQNPDTEPLTRARIALAWEKIEDRKRILKMRPLPGSLKPEPKGKAKRPVQMLGPIGDAPDLGAEQHG